MGAFLCFALLYLLFSFIWGYEVSGNELYSDAHMIALVKEYGLLPGSRIDKFDYDCHRAADGAGSSSICLDSAAAQWDNADHHCKRAAARIKNSSSRKAALLPVLMVALPSCWYFAERLR